MQVHMLLLAMLYHFDSTQTGYVSCTQFRLACEVLAAKFPHEAAACQQPEAVQRALGAAGEPTVDAPSDAVTAATTAEAGGGWLNIHEIAMRFLIMDAALDAQSAAAAATPSAVSAAVSVTPAPPAADGDGVADPAGPFSRIARPGAKEDGAGDAWQFDLVGHSRMAAFHHLLAHGRLAEIARSMGVGASVQANAVQSAGGSAAVGANAAHTGASTTATTRAPAPVVVSAAQARKPQRRIRNETRRGSLPYSVIAAHLDEVRCSRTVGRHGERRQGGVVTTSVGMSHGEGTWERWEPPKDPFRALCGTTALRAPCFCTRAACPMRRAAALAAYWRARGTHTV